MPGTGPTLTPSQGGNTIWIAGEAFTLAGNVKVITFKDDPFWDFANLKAPSGVDRDSYWYQRRLKLPGGGRQPVTDLEGLRQCVRMVMFHTDQCRDAKMCHEVLVNRGLSSHFSIDWDGTIYQTLDPLLAALHGGEANERSIGIDMNNILDDVLASGDANRPYPYPAEQAVPGFERPLSEIVEIQGSKKKSWGYTDAQYTATIELLKVLCDLLNIPKQPPLDAEGEVVNRVLDDFSGFEGLIAHWHTSVTRWDPGPGFDWQRVYHALRGEHNSFPVVIEEGQNVADLLVPDKVEVAAEKVYQNAESGDGGFYPIGVNQNWHGGIHLYVPRGSDVRAMVDGFVVAARMGSRESEFGDTTPLGSNNFVLLRHDIAMPKSDPLRVFSLYMHLDRATINPADKDNAPYEWLKAAYRVHGGELQKEDESTEVAPPTDEDQPKAAAKPVPKKPPAKGPAVAKAPAKPAEKAAAPASGEEEEADGRYAKREVKPYLEVDKYLGALRSGRIALFDSDPPERQIKVKAGEVIGAVGEFGEEDERKPLVHVEVFADDTWERAIDMGDHARFWVKLAEDMGSDLRVDTDDVLTLFQTSANRRRHMSFFRRVRRELLPQEIQDFFNGRGDNDEAKAWLRKAITRHVSEWSDQVDWVKALANAQDWSDKTRQMDELFQDRGGKQRQGIFTREIRKYLPFIWLNGQVAQHIGLQGAWNGILYHFHPIHFMMWLTYHSSSRVKALSTGKSLKELKKERDKQQKAEEEARVHGAVKENAEDYHEDSGDLIGDIEESSASEVLQDYLSGKPGQDEWRPRPPSGD